MQRKNGVGMYCLWRVAIGIYYTHCMQRKNGVGCLLGTPVAYKQCPLECIVYVLPAGVLHGNYWARGKFEKIM